MFSLAHTLQSFLIKRQEKRLLKKIQKDRLQALRNVFETPMETLSAKFVLPISPLSIKFPYTEYLGELGLQAYMVKLHVETEAFSALMSLIRENSLEVTHNHFERNGKNTILVHNNELYTTNAWLLTNNADLIQTIHQRKFSPPPPWVAWYEIGPIPYTQGEPAYWFDHIWLPYWSNLSKEEQQDFIAQWRQKTKPYISEEDWLQWVFQTAIADPKSRHLVHDA